MKNLSRERWSTFTPDQLDLYIKQRKPAQEDLSKMLYLSVISGRAKLIPVLVRHGADLKMRDQQTGWSLLHAAVENLDEESIRELVRLGTPIDSLDPSGASALHLAVDVQADSEQQTGIPTQFVISDLLLELGADPSVRDSAGRTPRDWALEAGYSEFGKLLPSG